MSIETLFIILMLHPLINRLSLAIDKKDWGFFLLFIIYLIWVMYVPNYLLSRLFGDKFREILSFVFLTFLNFFFCSTILFFFCGWISKFPEKGTFEILLSSLFFSELLFSGYFMIFNLIYSIGLNLILSVLLSTIFYSAYSITSPNKV